MSIIITKGMIYMDIKTFAAAAGLLISLLLSSAADVFVKYDSVTDGLLRLHILANSDSGYDQDIKLKIRDRLLEHSEELFGGCGSKEEMMKAASENLAEIERIADEVTEENGCGYKTHCELVNMHFDRREYGEYTVPAGEYTALRVTVGSGEGHNWWCVMYPALCLPSCSEEDLSDADIDEDILTEPEKYEPKLYIAEFISELFDGTRPQS